MKDVEFDEWVDNVPVQLREDPLWSSAYYRLAMYLFDLDIIKQITSILSSTIASHRSRLYKG
jgi:hypothetical protein